jgi:hypothetical protein
MRLAVETGKLKATKRLKKRGAYPPVQCTLCSAALPIRLALGG